MSSVKRHWLWLWLILLPLVALGEGVPFTVQGEDTGETSVAELKQKAVQNYLARQMGSRYQNIAEQITPEFAENYVLDYQVGRVPGSPKSLQLTGHIDAKSLMGWVRLTETKTQAGGAIKTGLVVSSDFPQGTLYPAETAARVRDNATARLLQELTQGTLQKFNVSVTTVGDPRFPLSRPVRRDSDVKDLRDYGAAAGLNTIFWAHLSPCGSCGGGKLTLSFYNLFQDRPAVVRSANIRMDAAQIASASGLRDDFAPAFEAFGKDLEDVISSGTLTSRILRLIVERIPNYRAFRAVQEEFNRLDFVAKATLKRTEPFLAEYELYSNLPPQELSQRFQNGSFANFSLQPVKVGSEGLVVRFVGKTQP